MDETDPLLSSTTVPTTTPGKDFEEIIRETITTHEPSIDIRTSTYRQRLNPETVSIITSNEPRTESELKETSTIMMPSVDANVDKQNESGEFVSLSTNTETNSLVTDDFEPLFEDLEEPSNDVTRSQDTSTASTSSSSTTITSTTVSSTITTLSEQTTKIEEESNEATEIPNTRTNLIEIISPIKSTEKETYEFQDEFEAVNQLNKTIHDLELALTTNDNGASVTNTEETSEKAENAPTLHNDAINHQNPLDTHSIENKVELIELSELHDTDDEKIKEDIVMENLSKPVNAQESTPLEEVNMNNDDSTVNQDYEDNSIPDLVNGVQHVINVNLSKTEPMEVEILYDDENDENTNLPADDTTTNTSILSLNDDMENKDMEDTTDIKVKTIDTANSVGKSTSEKPDLSSETTTEILPPLVEEKEEMLEEINEKSSSNHQWLIPQLPLVLDINSTKAKPR